VLGGKCRKCCKNISWQYPLVEIITAILFLLLYLKFGITYYSITLMLITTFLVVIFTYDLYEMIIPDIVIIPAIFIFIIFWFLLLVLENNLGIDLSALNLLYGAIIGAGFIGILVLFTKGKGMGIGDIKLSFLLGFMLGINNSVLMLFAGFVLGAIVGIMLLLSKSKNLKSKIPFGPFLIAGFYFALLYGDKIVAWYLK